MLSCSHEVLIKCWEIFVNKPYNYFRNTCIADAVDTLNCSTAIKEVWRKTESSVHLGDLDASQSTNHRERVHAESAYPVKV